MSYFVTTINHFGKIILISKTLSMKKNSANLRNKDIKIFNIIITLIP